MSILPVTASPATPIPHAYPSDAMVAGQLTTPQPPLASASARRTRRESGDISPLAPAHRWTLSSAQVANPDRRAADKLLGERLLNSMQDGYSVVQVPPGTSLAPALAVYRQVLAHPELQAWFTSKGLETDTLTFRKDTVSGYVNRNGVRTAVTFNTSDGSGWWQASVKLRAIRDLLDPADKGVDYLAGDEDWVPHSLVMQAFGMPLPAETDERAQIITQLRTSGLVMSPEPYQRISSGVVRVRQTIGDLDERAYLAEYLQGQFKDLPDDTPVDLSQQQASLSVDSSLAADDQPLRERLQAFSQSPDLQALLKSKELLWPGQPFRICEGKLEHRTSEGEWVDVTSYVTQVTALGRDLSALVSLSQTRGNAVYSQPYYDIRQLLDHKGLGSPRTAGETRNAVQWLRTALPPAPALGNYSGLMDDEWSPGQLTPEDKTLLKAWLDDNWKGASPRGLGYLDQQSVPALQQHPSEHLQKLLDSQEALTLGEQLARLLKWQGTPLSKPVRQQLVIAALKLRADPNAPAKPGHIADYNLYQPANMGRPFSAVRGEVEKHLQDHHGLDPKMAALAAHIGFAQAAPEFLVRDVPQSIHIGTPAWMELRLGAAMAERTAPGTSRRMSEEQVSELTTLAPTSEGQATLVQLEALKVLLDWAVLNGVVPAAVDGQHPPSAVKTASEAFFKQRSEVNEAVNTLIDLPMRRSLASEQLLKVFPDVTPDQLEKMKVLIADVDARRNLPISEPRTRSLIETYMTGDLIPGKWVLADDMPQSLVQPRSTPFQIHQGVPAPADKRAELDARIRRLPDLDSLVQTAVNEHRQRLQKAYGTQLKLMFAELPLADRQFLEKGQVRLFTLRAETGLPPVEETAAHRAAAKGLQGTLMRVQHGATVRYYEVFANGKIVKRTDLPKTLRLGDVLAGKPNPLGLQGAYVVAFTGGFPLAVDFDAYANGSVPRADTTSKVIIEALGAPIPGEAPATGDSLSTEVPNSFASPKINQIATRIAQDNFYESADGMLARAKGTLPLERRREVLAREKAILTGLVPFVGAYQDFTNGNIGSGLFNLALDVGGLALGAGGRVRSLLRAGKGLTPNPVIGIVRRLGSTVAPVTPKIAWSKPVARFGDRAFNFIKESVLFTSAAMNPADGYAQLVDAGLKGLFKITLLAGGVSRLGKAAPHLVTVEEKLRAYWLAGGWSRASTPVQTGTAGTSQGVVIHAIQVGEHWYATDPEKGVPFGTPLHDFKPSAMPVA